MSAVAQLLDTPKKSSLQTQSTQIRATLKEFERSFAADNHGRKPSNDDIKANSDIAATYKQYNKIRDVLSGKLEYSALCEQPNSPTRRRRHERTDSGVSLSPKKRSHNDTPRKLLHPSRSNDLDAADFESPKPLLYAIGPTPQRDGRVLGLFDLLSNSAHSSKGTSGNRKRKLDVLTEDTSEQLVGTTIVQTPSQRRVRREGDILDFLAGTPEKTPETGHRKCSRTPVSEGRKFMLSQFFATPSTVRFSNADVGSSKQQTPLRDRILGKTPDVKAQSLQSAPDVTPAYLRRSTSFKDRLLSASQPSFNNSSGLISPPATRAGPPTLKHLRSVSSLFSTFATDFPDIEEEEDDHEDDLEALREMEESHVNVRAQDSQQRSDTHDENQAQTSVGNSQYPQRTYKKKGQKRTTRRAIMRPTKGQSKQAPKFVAAGHEYEDENDLSRLHATQPDGRSRDDQPFGVNDLSDEDFIGGGLDDSDFEQINVKKPKSLSHEKVISTKEKPKKTGTINPNAVSHMNFRTLKIKNKNSKAKKGGKFGRGRR